MASGGAKVNWRLDAELAYNAAMTHRAMQLYLSGITSIFNRLRHDLGRELTVLTASVVLFATFFYVFNDFLNVQVLSLSAAMRERGAELATAVLLLVATMTSARFIRDELRGDRTLSRLATYLGETQGTVRTYLVLRFATTLVVVHGAAWWATFRWLIRPESTLVAGAEAAMLAATFLLSRLKPSAKSLAASTTTHTTLSSWRWHQLTRRNRATKACLVAAAPFLGLVAWSAWRSAPLFVSVAAAMLMGILAASSLAFQMAEDLPNAWTERGMGVSHDAFVKAYVQLGIRLAVWSAGLAAAVYFAATMSFAGAYKVALVAAIPAVAAPGLLLQVDGRRPAVNVILIILAGLFLGTAVYASTFALILIPILHYYALQSQAGRFYRA